MNAVSFSAELSRKVLHLSTLIFPLALLYLGKSVVLPALLLLSMLALFAEWLQLHDVKFQQFIQRYFGFMMRAKECVWENGKLCLNGATFTLLGCTLTILLFPAPIAAAALLISITGDAAAALVGRKWGKYPVARTNKTLAGTLAFLLTATLVLILFHPVPWTIGLAGALIGALVEIAPLPLNDNLRIPLITGLSMWVLCFFTQNACAVS